MEGAAGSTLLERKSATRDTSVAKEPLNFSPTAPEQTKVRESRVLGRISHNGAVETTRPFAATWTAVSGRPSILITATRLYRLHYLTWPRGVPGQAVAAATPCEIDLMAAWLAAFHVEAQAEAPSQDWRAVAERRINTGQVHLWQVDGVFVSLAAVSAPAVGVARVGPVYTPPASRRRGYGATLTAYAAATALATGAEHVVLYTDLANPTSNSIYQKIGFAADHDAEERAFR